MFDTTVEVSPAVEIGVSPEQQPGAVLALQCEYLADRMARLDDAELVELIVSIDRMRRWSDGLRARTIAAFADRHPAGTSAPPPGGAVPSPVTRWLPDELGLALRQSRQYAQSMIAEAQRLAHVLPDTLDALQAGLIDERRADAISFATVTLPEEKAREVEAAVLPKATDATLRQVQDRTRRAVHRVDPDGEHRRHRAARQDRRVTVTPREEGMASLWILTSSPVAEASFTMLTRLAHGLGPHDPRPLDQRRADLANQSLQGRLTLTGLEDLRTAAGSGSPVGTEQGTPHPAPDGPSDQDLVDAVAAGLARQPQVNDTARKPLIQVVIALDTLTGRPSWRATDRSRPTRHARSPPTVCGTGWSPIRSRAGCSTTAEPPTGHLPRSPTTCSRVTRHAASRPALVERATGTSITSPAGPTTGTPTSRT